MTEDEESSPFASTEQYYAGHRPGYGDATLRYLVERFDLGDTSRVLDLGCGAGQVAVPLAAHAGTVVGMDPNERMLREARQRAETAGRENVEWVLGSDADLGAALGTFRLATMGRSFHWMDQERTLDRLSELLEPDGGVAILNDAEWVTRGRKPWQADVYALAETYLDDLPERVGPADVEYDDPWDELVDEVGFTGVEQRVFEFRREWGVDDVVGYVFSLSFCSPETFGDDRRAFERDLRRLLADRDGEPFMQEVEVTVIAGRKP